MRNAFAIARKDLRQRMRDRSALVVGVLAPVLIAGLMSLAFHGLGSFSLKLGVVNDDHGAVATSLTRALSAPDLRRVISVRSIDSVSSAQAELRAGKVDAVLVLPAGLTASVASGRPATLTTLTTNNNTVAGDVVKSVAGSFVGQINADRLSVATALAAGAPSSPSRPAPPIAALVAKAAKLRIPITAVQRPIGARQLSVISYYSPGMAIFFLLFTVSYTARSFFVDRSEGLIERMRVAPVRAGEILAGKAMSVFVYGTLSLATVGIITSAVFGADWGAPLPAILLALALVFSVVCLTAFVISVCRTQRQAEGVSSLVVFALALLGGNFFYITTAPSTMKRLALFTPNGWALRGFTDLATIGGGFGTIVQPLLAILAFGVIVGGIALYLAPRAVRA